ncbi:MAG: DNA-directed RNA polymerase subunit delta [Erysipelotrichaceae bacterium]|nr:DNA-directed RNA polymerase subunit delta [Erysipelotrichaceae bacterium]
MAAKQSMTDIAYEILSKKKRAFPFAKLWEEVSAETSASNDMIAQFYSDLTLDSRFVSMKDNKWDLIERRKFEETHIDLSELELDDDEESEEGEEEEYN